MVIPFSFTFKSPALRVCLISFKVIQILNSAVSGEMLQVAFSFQNFAIMWQNFVANEPLCGKLAIMVP